MRVFILSVLGLVLMLSPARAYAEQATYHFDKAHTQILFFVNHLGFSNSQGKFLDFDGHFVFDENDPESSSVEVVIQTDSIDMDDEAWDAHLKNEDFFNVAEFPVMVFKSTSVELTGENTANLTGDLTLLGVTRPVVLAATHNKSGKFPFGNKYVSGFSARGMLKRSDFGMDYGLPGVSDEVELRIEVEGIRQEEGGEGAVNH